MLLRQQHILLPNPSLFLFFSEFLLIFEKVEKISEDNDDIFLLTSKNSAISSVFFIVFKSIHIPLFVNISVIEIVC